MKSVMHDGRYLSSQAFPNLSKTSSIRLSVTGQDKEMELFENTEQKRLYWFVFPSLHFINNHIISFFPSNNEVNRLTPNSRDTMSG